MMSQVVGPKGHVVGIEINAGLADHSRKCIKSLSRDIDFHNLTIMSGDGGKLIPGLAPFDRVLVMAGSQSFPVTLFEQINENGKVIIPLSNRGGGEEVYLLRKEDNRVRAIAATPGFYVPLTESMQLGHFHRTGITEPGCDRPRCRLGNAHERGNHPASA